MTATRRTTSPRRRGALPAHPARRTHRLRPDRRPTPPASQVESTHSQIAERAPSPASGPIADAQDAKVARTFQLRSRTLGAAQTAVLLTAAHQGGYASLNALVEGALSREL